MKDSRAKRSPPGLPLVLSLRVVDVVEGDGLPVAVSVLARQLDGSSSTKKTSLRSDEEPSSWRARTLTAIGRPSPSTTSTTWYVHPTYGKFTRGQHGHIWRGARKTLREEFNHSAVKRLIMGFADRFHPLHFSGVLENSGGRLEFSGGKRSYY
eukprot:1194596-Prorocentrum_minimum.AAC.1